MSNKIGIYLEGKKLDLFDDENINITSKATDINNIGAVYTDFSQSFTVQASPNNNAIFQHFYDTDLIGTFNSNVRVPCYIEVDTIPFKIGKVQLESIQLKNKIPSSYKITFYGNLTQLDDSFKDDELSVLNFDEFTHNYTVENVNNGIQLSTFMGGDLIYPLIGQSPFQYGTNNMYDISIDAGAINFTELKPAIRLQNIIDKIQTHYGITFKGSFLDSANYKNLFMWLSKEKGNINALSEETDLNLTTSGNMSNVGATINYTTNEISFNQVGGNGGTSNLNGAERYYLSTVIAPAPGFQSVPYKVIIYVNDIAVVTSDFVMGGNTFYYNFKAINLNITTPQKVRITVTSKRELTYLPYIKIIKRTYTTFPSATNLVGEVTDLYNTLTAIVNVREQLPKMKVKDLLSGLIKAFNLVIRPIKIGEFELTTLDDFRASGDIFDITKYVNIDTIDIARPLIYSSILFKYQKSETILSKRFRETFDTLGEVGYGDLRATYNIDDKKELKIELPFELLMFERLPVQSPNPNSGELTNIHIGSVIENKPPYEAVQTKPILFYNNGIIRHQEYPFKLNTGAGTPTATVYYSWNVGAMNDIEASQVRNTLNWGSNISTWDYTDEKNSLYNNYWKKYIEGIYSLKQRKFSLSSLLPPSIINSLSINDKLIINDQRYNIEDYTLNLRDGMCKLTLSNDIRTFDYTEGINYTTINTTSAGTYYTVKIKTVGNWAVSKVANGSGVTWLSFITPTSGSKDGYVTFKIDPVPHPSGTERTMVLNFNLNGVVMVLPITQEGIV